MKAKVGVVGGGIFGVTTACKLAETFEVDLYELNSDILQAASGINQFRLHRGYHYPRSDETADSALASEPLFRLEYFEALMNDIDSYYFLAKHGSKTNQTDFLKFCDKHKLPYFEEYPSLINKNMLQLGIKVKESLIDPIKLKEICWRKLREKKVNVKLNARATKGVFQKYDQIIIATYANLNELLEELPEKHQDFQYELCEKIVVELPKSFENKSLVILDGDFMCIDPYGSTGLFLMGNVIHATHQANIGKFPIFDSKFKKLLNKGVIKNPLITNFKKFIETTEQFIPQVKYAKHFGSMYTFRTVLPYKDKTDERPTFVRQINNKIITIFSGKIVTCVEAAEQVASLLGVSKTPYLPSNLSKPAIA